MELNFAKRGGLVPTVVQDYRTGALLMLAYVNPGALRKTMETGLATFWSTSRNELWTKGLTSGDTLDIMEVRTDCDADALLYVVNPQGSGGACHLDGWYSCFGRKVKNTENFTTYVSLYQWQWSTVLFQEERLIQARQRANSPDSHTAQSINELMARVAQKIGEEGLEVALALTDPEQDNQKVIGEVADLLYRLQIGLAKANINWSDVEDEIVRRRK